MVSSAVDRQCAVAGDGEFTSFFAQWGDPASHMGIQNGVPTFSTGDNGYTSNLSFYDLSSYSPGDSAMFAAAPNNGFGKTPVHGLWTYGNWCGAGGSGTPINSTDAACMAHDQCYDNLNLNADQYMSGNLSPSQIQGAAACNQQLCNAALNANRNPSTPFSQRWAGAEIILFFSLTGPKGARCQGF